MKKIIIALFLIMMIENSFAQNNVLNDSAINSVWKNQVKETGEGAQLILEGNFRVANTFFTSEISKDEADRNAYFQRGVANLAMSDTLSACRDWSAVLAMGDTAMFNLLDSKCNGSMIIEDDTIPKPTYRKLWASKDQGPNDRNTRTVVEVMPVFPGGEVKLHEYIKQNTKRVEQKRGTVYVNFLISPKGKILYPYIARGISKACDKEALRLVKNMPPWSPGKEKGKAVYVRSSVPVRF